MENITAFSRTNTELKSAINFMEVSTPLSKFMDVKSLLWSRYKDDAGAVGSAEECKQLVGRLVKNVERAMKLADSRVNDLSNKTEFLPNAAIRFIKELQLEISAENVKFSAVGDAEPRVLTIYQTQPRGNNFTYTVNFDSNFEAIVTNCFVAYPTEGFILSFDLGEFRISFTPEAKDGVKGSGALYIYCMKDGLIYKDLADKYLPEAKQITKIFRG